MTEIYLVRHCESLGNVLQVYNGTIDLDVSENGQKQLPFLAKRFNDIHIDAVYSSPLKRAMKTVGAVADCKNLPVIPCYDLIELDGGSSEGKPFADIFAQNEGLTDVWNNHPQDFSTPDGEHTVTAYDRIYNAIINIAHENPDKTVMVGTHGYVIRCLFARLLYGSIDRIKDIPWSDNTDVSLLRIDDNDNVEVVFYNDHSHLPEEFIPEGSRVGGFVKGE